MLTCFVLERGRKIILYNISLVSEENSRIQLQRDDEGERERGVHRHTYVDAKIHVGILVDGTCSALIVSVFD